LKGFWKLVVELLVKK